MFTSATAPVARLVRTLNEVPQVHFQTGIRTDPNLLPEGYKTVAQAIAHGWVKTGSGEWIGGPQ